MVYLIYMNYRKLDKNRKRFVASVAYNHIIKSLIIEEEIECDNDDISLIERKYRLKMLESPSGLCCEWITYIMDMNFDIDLGLEEEVVYDRFSYRSIFDILLKDMGLFVRDQDFRYNEKKRYMVRDFHNIVLPTTYQS